MLDHEPSRQRFAELVRDVGATDFYVDAAPEVLPPHSRVCVRGGDPRWQPRRPGVLGLRRVPQVASRDDTT